MPIKVGELDYILQDFNMVKIESRLRTDYQEERKINFDKETPVTFISKMKNNTSR